MKSVPVLSNECISLIVTLVLFFSFLSTLCQSRKAASTATTPCWWRTSASPSRGCPARPARRRTSSTRTTWPVARRSPRTTSTAEPPTCKSATVSVEAAGGGPTPTPPAGSSSRRSEASSLSGLIYCQGIMDTHKHTRTGGQIYQ